ncbi:hypothetical protein B1B_19304, partial [mine drainage metagenome]
YESGEQEEGRDIITTSPQKHTKEELGRLLNLWQQKYAQATTDEDRKMANEKIQEYQDEYARLKAENGTTPERARLIEGGGIE